MKKLFGFLDAKGLGKKTSWFTSIGAFAFGIIMTSFIMITQKRFPNYNESIAIVIIMWGASLVTGTTDLSIIINNFFKAKYNYKENYKENDSNNQHNN
ncbi:hypothetical protein A9X81_04830 [Brachyspira hyodysenteriae]|uniref:Uncharacterized protein n=2 Tax=Brachyspira TaxID=29521 RepID=G0EP25_BRAIP|nr:MULTISPECIES: hypothetical protein [Brachyspira]AEM20699.1 hypothetical protein Bint_0063 [Brachyspira intermedia PWS/A]PPS21190.1 hypothetical protein DJ52_12235 [Brachyspira murdochii]TVL67078.1 hypothetical protein A9X74_01105 [Brachyspira hyodysenteriae]TVL77084.1 hypothetical protein A9X81_04830 [Brachyspira hyodysenteriae]TVL86584.1 hypothetical protein A9X80_03850 [Brachyspira hyodysenteriae]